MIPGSAASMLPSAEAAKLYQTNYVRNSRVIGLLWAIFTILFGIVNVTIFSQPYWIGDGVDTPQAGYFGLFHYCVGDGLSRELACQGSFTEFAAIPSGAFKAASFFIGMSMMLVVTCIGCFSLFFLLSTSTVYKICGWMQALSGKRLSVPPDVGRRGAGGDLERGSDDDKCSQNGKQGNFDDLHSFSKHSYRLHEYLCKLQNHMADLIQCL